MKNAIIIHGKPDKEEYYNPASRSGSNRHWLPWLQKQLLLQDILAQTPEMPAPYDPQYAGWSREFERFDIGSDTILVGHSCGAGFIVRWLSEHPHVKVGKVVLVGPWINPGRVFDSDMFEFEIDPKLANRTAGLVIFHSTNDQESVQETVKILREKIEGIDYREFENQGHFMYSDMQTEEFPELRDEVLA